MGLGGHMNKCGHCWKYSMFITNAIIFIGGICLVGLGAWTVAEKSFANELLGTNLYKGAIYILMIAGIFLPFISFLGCFGALKEVRCLLVSYFIAVFIAFVTVLVGGILAFVFCQKVETTLMNNMIGSLRFYGNYNPITEAWDETQARLHCCGVHSPADWRDQLPDSCCREPVPGKRQRCQLIVQNNKYTLFMNGCYNVTKQYTTDHASIVGGLGIFIAFHLVLGMIISWILRRTIDDD